jgi:hypothetical protein
MAEAADERKNVKISPAAFDQLTALVGEVELTQAVVLERSIAWVKSRSEQVREALLRNRGDAAALIADEVNAERLAAGETAPVTFEQAVRQIRSLTDQLAAMERAYRPIIEKAVAEAAAAKKNTSKKG